MCTVRPVCRDCISGPALGGLALTVAVLCAGIVLVDPTPHLPPDMSVGLTMGGLGVLALQVGAIAADHRYHGR